MATHLLGAGQSDSQDQDSVYSVTLEGGQQISFSVERTESSDDESPQRAIHIRYCNTAYHRLLSNQVLRLKTWIQKWIAPKERKHSDKIRAIFAFSVMLAVVGAVWLYLRVSTTELSGTALIENSNRASSESVPAEHSPAVQPDPSSEKRPTGHPNASGERPGGHREPDSQTWFD